MYIITQHISKINTFLSIIFNKSKTAPTAKSYRSCFLKTMEVQKSNYHRTHSLIKIVIYKIQTFIGLIPVEKFYIQKPLPVLCPISETEYIRWTVLPTNTLEKILNALLTTIAHTATAHCTERPSNTVRSFRSKTEKTSCSTCSDTIPEQCLQAIPVCHYG